MLNTYRIVKLDNKLEKRVESPIAVLKKSYPISRYWLHLQMVRSPYSLLRPKTYPLIKRRLFPVRFWMNWIENFRLTVKKKTKHQIKDQREMSTKKLCDMYKNRIFINKKNWIEKNTHIFIGIHLFLFLKNWWSLGN